MQSVRAPATCGMRPPTTPIVVADVMDTLVVDPFFNGMHSYFGFSSFEEFVAAKTPNLWLLFEIGEVREDEVARQFFRDGRSIDLHSFKHYLSSSYRLIPGIAQMLTGLRNSGIDVHLCTNYPVWADLIEEALQLTKYGVQWTFVSGREGVRKPEKEAFWRVARKAKVRPSDCVMLDNSLSNCHAAQDAGYSHAVHFQSPSQAAKELQDIFQQCDVNLRI